MRSILKDSDSQWSLETLSNFLPSGSMSFTSKMSSKSTPAILASTKLGLKTRTRYGGLGTVIEQSGTRAPSTGHQLAPLDERVISQP